MYGLLCMLQAPMLKTFVAVVVAVAWVRLIDNVKVNGLIAD